MKENQMTDNIYFYSTRGDYGFMSNFYKTQIKCFGRTWITSEHAYQAQKFSDMNQSDYDDVHNAKTAGDAASIGRDKNRQMRADWDDVRCDVMRFIVCQKFLQNGVLAQKLLATSDLSIFEHDTHRGDMFWAINNEKQGKNMLGIILMEVREILREDALAYELHNKEVDDCMDCKIARPTCWLHAESRVRPSDIYIASLRF